MSGFANIPDAGPIGQGAMAVRSGSAARNQVETLLFGAGLHLDDRSATLEEFRAIRPGGSLFGRGFYARDIIVGRCSFRRPLRLSFVAWMAGWPGPLGIQARSQAESGSADAKVVKDARDLCLAPLPSVLLLSGRHFEEDEGIHACVREYVANPRRRLLALFVGDAEFRRWVTQGMEWPSPAQPELI